MSGELQAVLIAGGIAVLPTIVQMFISAIQKNKTQKHEEAMKRIEFYEAPRRVELMKYLDLLGSVCSAFDNPNVLSDYSSAYVKISVLVDGNTFQSMEIIDKMILDRYDYDKQRPERKDRKGILNTPDYHKLLEYIRIELNPKEPKKQIS